VCRRTAQASGQWVGQRRLCGEYMAGIEAKTPKHQTIGAASAVETPVELYLVSVKGLSGRLAILIVISHPVCVRKSEVHKSCSSCLSIRPSTLAKVLFFVCKMLDFLEWFTNYLKYRRGTGTGRTIAPKSGVPAGVTMLPHHNTFRNAGISSIM
jgi:hypothetical protein